MSSIQGSINSMIGSAASAVRAVKGIQAIKAKQAVKAISGDVAGAVSAESETANVAPNEAALAKEAAIQHMEAAQEEKRNRTPIYGARGEVLNG